MATIPNNPVSKLFPHDKAHCEQVFKCYLDLSALTFNQRMYGFLEMDKVKSTHPNIFPEGIQLMEGFSKQLSLNRNDLAKTVIQTIESYFQKRYKLTFNSLLDSPSFQEELKDLTQLPNIDGIISNFLQQVGPQYFGPVFN